MAGGKGWAESVRGRAEEREGRMEVKRHGQYRLNGSNGSFVLCLINLHLPFCQYNCEDAFIKPLMFNSKLV